MHEGLFIEGLVVRYNGCNGRAVIRDLSLAVEPGEVFGIVGPSGAGKSSLLMALGGVIPSSGSIRIAAEEISLEPARRRRFGHVYQEFRLFEWMTVYDNVAFPCRARHWGDERVRLQVLKHTERLGLSGQEQRIVQDMSGGERQRVALARAMAAEPRALFLDEPFSHLDPPLRDDLRRGLTMSLSEMRIPVIVVTHDHEEAFRLCSRIGLLFDGVLVQTGSLADLISAPGSAAAASFLGYSNRTAGTARSAEGGQTVISTPDGNWRGRVISTDRGGLAEAMCRPADVTLSAASDGRSNSFTARLVSWQRGLDHTEAIVELPSGTTWVMQISNNQPAPSPGAIIECHVPWDRVLIYDATTGPRQDLPFGALTANLI